MDEMLACAVLVAVASHAAIKRYLLACAVSAGLAPLLYGVVEGVVEVVQHPDSHALVALLAYFPAIYGAGFIYSLGIAAVIGLPYLGVRGVRKYRSNQTLKS